jgi:hypothetical protein
MKRSTENYDRIQKVLKENKAERAERTNQEQIDLLKTRKGNSKKEIERLNKLIEKEK